MLINSGGDIARDGINKCAEIGETTTMVRSAFSSLCVLLYCCASALAYTYEDCGSTAGAFGEVSISVCDTASERCFLPRETDISVSVKFTPNKDTSSIEMRAFGSILDVPVPIPIPQPLVCKDPTSGITCPVKKDQEIEYKNTMKLEKKTPALTIDVIWQFMNDNGEKIFCIKFPAKIK